MEGEDIEGAIERFLVRTLNNLSNNFEEFHTFICCLLNRKESFLLNQFNKNNPTERKLIHERMEWKQFFSR